MELVEFLKLLKNRAVQFGELVKNYRNERK